MEDVAKNTYRYMYAKYTNIRVVQTFWKEYIEHAKQSLSLFSVSVTHRLGQKTLKANWNAGLFWECMVNVLKYTENNAQPASYCTDRH